MLDLLAEAFKAKAKAKAPIVIVVTLSAGVVIACPRLLPGCGFKTVSRFSLPLAAAVLMNEEGTKLILDQCTSQISIGSGPPAVQNQSILSV